MKRIVLVAAMGAALSACAPICQTDECVANRNAQAIAVLNATRDLFRPQPMPYYLAPPQRTSFSCTYGGGFMNCH
jgi:hypothetical protein